VQRHQFLPHEFADSNHDTQVCGLVICLILTHFSSVCRSALTTCRSGRRLDLTGYISVHPRLRCSAHRQQRTATGLVHIGDTSMCPVAAIVLLTLMFVAAVVDLDVSVDADVSATATVAACSAAVRQRHSIMMFSVA